MSRLADISVAIQEWVVSSLSASEELAAALGVDLADVSQRLWDSPPGSGEPMPYVDIMVGTPLDRGGVGVTEVMAVSEVTVKAVGQAEAYDPLSPIAVAIHHALHGHIGTPISGGGDLLSSRRIRVISYPEQVQGVEYRHLGGTYEVHAQ